MRMFDRLHQFVFGLTERQREERDRLQAIQQRLQRYAKPCPACNHPINLHPTQKSKHSVSVVCFRCSCELTQEEALA